MDLIFDLIHRPMKKHRGRNLVDGVYEMLWAETIQSQTTASEKTYWCASLRACHLLHLMRSRGEPEKKKRHGIRNGDPEVCCQSVSQSIPSHLPRRAIEGGGESWVAPATFFFCAPALVSLSLSQLPRLSWLAGAIPATSFFLFFFFFFFGIHEACKSQVDTSSSRCQH